MRERESLFSLHIVAAAHRVKDEHRQRGADAEHAFREWEHNPTLSNAIRRDDARKALLDLSDANTLALAVLEVAPDPDRAAEVIGVLLDSDPRV